MRNSEDHLLANAGVRVVCEHPLLARRGHARPVNCPGQKDASRVLHRCCAGDQATVLLNLRCAEVQGDDQPMRGRLLFEIAPSGMPTRLRVGITGWR